MQPTSVALANRTVPNKARVRVNKDPSLPLLNKTMETGKNCMGHIAHTEVPGTGETELIARILSL
jgi:hypothetical protein